MREFWVSSGHHLTRQSEGGGLTLTPELVLAYLARPELVPPDDACAAEKALYASLLAEPLRDVQSTEIDAIADPDGRENWQFFLGFRDRLKSHPTLEVAYVDFARHGAQGTPPMFLSQLTHLVLRNALEGCEDPFVLRAGELFYRPQKAASVDKVLVLGDAELIEAQEKAHADLHHHSPLTAMLKSDTIEDLDVMDEENAWTYWSRSDANSMVMNLGGNPKAREGLATSVAGWINHLTGLEAKVEPIARIEDQDWRWFIGLDPEATRIGNALWRGESISAADQDKIVALLKLEIGAGEGIVEDMRGKPIYLLLAVDGDRILRMKPQNLIAGLPLAANA